MKIGRQRIGYDAIVGGGLEKHLLCICRECGPNL